MKWWVVIAILVMLLLVGGWYYLKRPVVRETNRQEAHVQQAYTHEYRGTFVSLSTTSQILTLKGSDGRDYVFGIPKQLIENRDSEVVENEVGQPLIVEWNDARSTAQILAEYARDPSVPLNAGTMLVSIRRSER